VRLKQSLIVLCCIVLAVVLYSLRRTQEQKTAIDVLIENGKKSLSPQQLHLIESLEGDFKKSEDTESLRTLKSAWRKAGNVQVAAYYAFRLANQDSVFSSWKEAGMLLDTASRIPPGEVDLQAWFLRSGINCLEQARALTPSDAEVKVALAGLLADGEGRVMEGVRLLRDVIALDSMNVPANLKLGELSMMSGQYENAVARFKAATRADSNNVDAWIGLGNALNAQGNEWEGLLAFAKAYEIDSNSTKKWFVPGGHDQEETQTKN
jgi:tetratricopeptide (TPR) repeat protein